MNYIIICFASQLSAQLLRIILSYAIFSDIIIEKDRKGRDFVILRINDCTEPFFNMACEEYLLMTFSEPTVMLWRNSPAVIIGRNQNARENVNFEFTKANGIKVVRRLTGGGTVFHDLGNVNYTFIVPESDAPDSFSEFSKPILSAIGSLGIEAEASGRNDLLSGGRKFSGTARCGYIYNGRMVIMHHGTLLFSADMSSLSGALTTDGGKAESKGIKSAAARVINLHELLPDKYSDMTSRDFMKYLENYFITENGAKACEFSQAEKAEISKLAKEKYETEAWLLRAGAEDFDITRKKRFDFGTVEVSLSCRADEVGMPAKISKARIEGDFFGDCDISDVEKLLSGADFEKNAVLALLESVDMIKYIRGAEAEELASLIFG